MYCDITQQMRGLQHLQTSGWASESDASSLAKLLLQLLTCEPIIQNPTQSQSPPPSHVADMLEPFLLPPLIRLCCEYAACSSLRRITIPYDTFRSCGDLRALHDTLVLAWRTT